MLLSREGVAGAFEARFGQHAAFGKESWPALYGKTRGVAQPSHRVFSQPTRMRRYFFARGSEERTGWKFG